MDLGLDGKAVLVTAASEGIGKFSALALAAEGAHVAICARRPDVLEAARAEIDGAGPGRVLAVQADLGRAADVERVVAETVAAFGGLNALVNNMGVSVRGEDDEVWDEMFQLNLMATVRATRSALPHLREAAAQPGADSSAVVHIGSIFGREAGGSAQYNAMKAAVMRSLKAPLEIEEIQIAKPGPHEVLVRTAATGICSPLGVHVTGSGVAFGRSSSSVRPARP